MKKRPVSICMIAHNEAHNIERCLDSVADWSEEIILVINDCTDGTDTLAAEKYGAAVYKETWHGHRDQKNIALQKATKKWVFCIDADEEVDGELRENILAFIDADDAAYNGAYFPRKLWFLGRWIMHGDWYPDHSLRLIRNGKGKWGGAPEHDKMILEGKAKKLSGHLLHFSFPELNGMMNKMCYYSDVFLQRQLDAGKQWSAMRAVSRASWRFFRHYFLRRGFLDGYPGLFIGWLQAFSCFYRYSRLYEYIQKNKQAQK